MSPKSALNQRADRTSVATAMGPAINAPRGIEHADGDMKGGARAGERCLRQNALAQAHGQHGVAHDQARRQRAAGRAGTRSTATSDRAPEESGGPRGDTRPCTGSSPDRARRIETFARPESRRKAHRRPRADHQPERPRTEMQRVERVNGVQSGEEPVADRRAGLDQEQRADQGMEQAGPQPHTDVVEQRARVSCRSRAYLRRAGPRRSRMPRPGTTRHRR